MSSLDDSLLKIIASSDLHGDKLEAIKQAFKEAGYTRPMWRESYETRQAYWRLKQKESRERRKNKKASEVSNGSN